MAITVKHLFVSAKGDGSDATLVRPSNWNANHDIQLATSKIIGRLTAGPGTAEELPVTSYMIGLLNTADYATLAIALGLPTTGDAKLTFKATADVGWVLANDGSIGDVGSGSTTAAANTLALFTFFYNNFSDSIAPLQTSAGAGTTRVAQGTAATAFGAKCRMVLPKQLGRALIVAGSGSGLSARALGSTGGAEVHQLVTLEMPKHFHTATNWGLANTSISGTASGSANATLSGSVGFNDTDHSHNTEIANLDSGTSMNRGYNLSHAHGGIPNDSGLTTGGYVFTGPGGGASYAAYNAFHGTDGSGTLDHSHYVDPPNTGSTGALGGAYGTGQHKHALSGTFGGAASINTWTGVTVSGNTSGTTDAMGTGDGAHNNMQPWTAWNVMIRL